MMSSRSRKVALSWSKPSAGPRTRTVSSVRARLKLLVWPSLGLKWPANRKCASAFPTDTLGHCTSSNWKMADGRIANQQPATLAGRCWEFLMQPCVTSFSCFSNG